VPPHTGDLIDGPAPASPCRLAAITLDELEDDPFPALAWLREHAPVAFLPATGMWLLTRFEDVREAHRESGGLQTYGPPELSECLGEHHILNVEGSQHARYRAGLNASLSPRAVSDHAAGQVEDVVASQLGALVQSERGDLVADYFEPISVRALGRILGVPEIDPDELRRWFHAIIAGSSNLAGDRDIAQYANRVSAEIDGRLAPTFARLAREPDGSLLSHMLANASGDSVAQRVADITPTVKVIVSGGLQEPGHGASTVAAALLGDAELRARFAASPGSLVDAAVEEGLRWVAPIQHDTRRTRGALELHGVTIPAGVDVGLSVASANRDERVFGADADRFDLDRPRRAHVAFGYGAHFCPGNYFGRFVIRTAIQRLFERLPDIELVAPVRFRGFIFRAPVALPCRWGGSSRSGGGERASAQRRSAVDAGEHDERRRLGGARELGSADRGD
jgi:cytochrome P450